VSIDEVCTGNTSCNLDLIDHLRQNFISYHSSAVEISLCDISNLMGCLSKTSVRKVIWQLLMYIDFEAKLILINESQNSSMIILDIQFLEEILTFFPLFKNKPNCNSNEDIKIKQCNISTEEMDIMKDLLKHPILLKLFLFDMNAVENSVECVKNVTVAITKFVLNIAKKISNFSNESLYSYLTPFKKKILKFFQKAKMHAFTEDIELSYIVGTFILFFGFDDIQIILQTLLNVENTNFQNFDAYFPTLCLLIQIFIEKKEFVLLSSTCINALISAFASSPKKRKKVLGQYIYQLLLQHPIYAFLFTEDSMMILLQHSSIQDLNILGVLIDYSNKFRQITQTFISDSLEEANTVKFLYLASKCLCNAEKENKSETEFKDLIFSRFFDTFKEFVLSDLTNDLDILHNCTIGKSVQVLLQDKENSKILRHFCKSLMKNHSDEVPSVSKMHAILQLFHSWKLCSDNNKTRLRILKVCFLWLSTGLNTDFKNLELTNFIKEMIENMDCLEIDEVIDVTDFFQKSLKFALKSDDIGKDILKILCLLCEKSKGNHLPVQCIHGLVCGHSCFLKIMLTEKEKKNILKEHLIDLLTVLTKLDGSVCKENHIGFLLSAYSASMSNIDQKLLYLLKLYADNNIDMNDYSPFVWGKSAISHYSVMKASERFLWKKPSLQDVLSLFVPEKIETTILYFPLTMKLQPCSKLFEMDSHLANKIYDMRFILPLFAHLLSP
ncbi:nucleolar pre-ribosomal-associated protein 1, partial [Trichonephila clavata]